MRNPQASHTYTNSCALIKHLTLNGVQLPTSLLSLTPDLQADIFACVSVCIRANMCLYAPSALACCVLLAPGSIWLTQVVCIKGLGVFRIHFAPLREFRPGWGDERHRAARGQSEKHSHNFLLESIHSVTLIVSFSQLLAKCWGFLLNLLPTMVWLGFKSKWKTVK